MSMLEGAMGKVVKAVIGVILFILILEFKDRIGAMFGFGPPPAMTSFPSRLWGGGGGRVTLEVEGTGNARAWASFYETKDGDDDGRSQEVFQVVEAGVRTWDIDVPAAVSGSFGATWEGDPPPPGSKLRVTLKVNGVVALEDARTLDAALPEGYSFGVQVEIGDWATGKPSED